MVCVSMGAQGQALSVFKKHLWVSRGCTKSETHNHIGNGSIPINTIFSGMNSYLPAILRFTRYQGFDP